MLPVEALAGRPGVGFASIWRGDGRHDRVEVVEKPWTPQREVQLRPGVEDDDSAIGIPGATSHARSQEPGQAVSPPRMGGLTGRSVCN